MEGHPWHGIVCKAPQMLLVEGRCENSPAVNPHSCSKCGAGINCTRSGFIGEVACTSLVFNFRFSFNCPFLGGFKDFHNSFQPAHHGANPTALPPPPLPHTGSLEPRQISVEQGRGRLLRQRGHDSATSSRVGSALCLHLALPAPHKSGIDKSKETM